MRILYSLALLVCFNTFAFAQNAGYDIAPLPDYRVLKSAAAKAQPENLRPDSINLPFVEDFSYNGPYPDANLWLDNKVFVNNTMAGSPPSVGAATFDAIDFDGTPYGSGIETGSCDTLTSNFINLATYRENAASPLRNLAPADSVYLSFFLQPKGLCYAPIESDSMVLEYRDRNGNWTWIRTFQGLPARVTIPPSNVAVPFPLDSVPPFVPYFLKIDEQKYFYGKFQFRFRNFGRRGGAYEQWHLDYVKIAPNRRFNARNLDDLAFVDPPRPILRRYTSMPWRHARPQLATEVQDTLTTRFFNHFPSARNPTNTNARVTTSDGTTLVSGITILDGVNVPINAFYQSVPKVYTSLKGQLGAIGASVDRFSVNTEYNLTIESQEGRDTFKAAIRNDVVRANTVFDNYFAYDDGSAEMQFTATGENMQVAVRFRANVADTLRGVQFYFPRINQNASGNFNLRIWKDTLMGTPLFELRNVKPFYLDTRVDTLQGFTSYSLGKTKDGQRDTFVVIPAGDFYIGWQNVGDVRVPIGLDRNNRDKSQYIYQFLDTQWSPITQRFGAVMVRPVVGRNAVRNSSTLSTRETPLSDVMTIFPNPAQERLFVDLKQGDESDYQVRIFNLTGQVMSSAVLRGGQIDLSELADGLYVLKIYDLKNNRLFNHKFVKAKP